MDVGIFEAFSVRIEVFYIQFSPLSVFLWLCTTSVLACVDWLWHTGAYSALLRSRYKFSLNS